jgi:ribosome-associated protein
MTLISYNLLDVFMVKNQPIFIKGEYITLGQFLKFKNLISNGGAAKFFLINNSILVNGVEEKRRGRKLKLNDEIKINNEQFLIQIKGE